MLLQQSIDTRHADKLAAMVEQHLSAGGRIEQLPGPTFTPPPPRIEGKSSAKNGRRRRDITLDSVKRYRESGPEIIRLFESGVPFKYIAQQTGRSEGFVNRCLEYHGIDARAIREEQRLKAVAEDVEKIRIMVKDGHSARYIAEQLGVSESRVRYQAGQSGIEFRRAK